MESKCYPDCHLALQSEEFLACWLWDESTKSMERLATQGLCINHNSFAPNSHYFAVITSVFLSIVLL